MHIAYGSTRVVLLIGAEAIKIGRIRPLRFFARMFLLLFSLKRREHFFAKYGPSFWSAARNDILAGLYANRNEYEYYEKTKDNRVMPTTQQLLGGWIILQVRGRSISAAELPEKPSIKECADLESCEVTKKEQFCRHPDGRVVLIDYGRRATIEALGAV